MKHNYRSKIELKLKQLKHAGTTQTYSSSIRPLSAPVSSLATPCAKSSTDG